MTGDFDPADSKADLQGGLPTAAQIRADIGAVLDLAPFEIGDDEDLIDLGMDSVRLMSLVQKWRDQGAAIDFADLAERPEAGAWIALLVRP